jgi:ankyrin repeat protein
MSGEGSNQSKALLENLAKVCRLKQLCLSESLSLDGLREIIGLDGCGVPSNDSGIDNNYKKFFLVACLNERVTEGILRYLLQYFPGAATFVDQNMHTALHLICYNKNVTIGMVQLLIDAFPGSLCRETKKGNMPLHCLCRNDDLDDKEGGLKILKLLLEKCPESVRHADMDGMIPLHLAAAKQSPEFCRILVEAYPGSERVTNNNGVLPFQAACQCNAVATVKYLYQLYPESINGGGRSGAHPIHSAIVGLENTRNPIDSVEVLKFLMDCNPDALSSTGETLLHIAFVNKNVTLGTVQLLIDAFPESLHHGDHKGFMPLHRFCLNNNRDEAIKVKILNLLLERYPESVRHSTGRGNLPIHIAAANQSPEFCRILIEAYPGSERITTDYGMLPFHAACRCNTVATAKYLYQLYPEIINVATNDGWYPIHHAIMGLNRRNNPKYGIEVMRFLLDCNLDVVLQKRQGKLPFFWVCKEATNETPKLNAYLKIVQMLYDAYPEAIESNEVKSDVGEFCAEVQTFINTQITYARQAKDLQQMKTPDENGQLPLHKAFHDYATITLGSIKLLVKGNPSAIREVDNRGMIPLHIACQHHVSPAVVEYLINLNEVTLGTIDDEGNTALHYACRGANHSIIALLLDKYGSISVSKQNAQKHLPIDLLFQSKNELRDNESVKFTESIYRLIRANPETLMHYDLEQAGSEDRLSQQDKNKNKKKKRKIDEVYSSMSIQQQFIHLCNI